MSQDESISNQLQDLINSFGGSSSDAANDKADDTVPPSQASPPIPDKTAGAGGAGAGGAGAGGGPSQGVVLNRRSGKLSSLVVSATKKKPEVPVAPVPANPQQAEAWVGQINDAMKVLLEEEASDDEDQPESS